MADFTDALEKIVLGAPRKMVLTEDDRRLTAYHEAGHAIVGMLTPGADPVRKVSIIPRGRALGVTLSAPEIERVSYDRKDLEGKLDVAFGGRAAEELVFDDVTTGAESDIEQVTGMARAMVGRWGMSEKVGFLAVLPREATPYVADGWSDTTRLLVDDEVRRIVDAAHDRVLRLLTEHREKLDSLAEALLERETLDQDDAYAAAGIAPESASLAPR
jgi:cell division protease FtsH